MHRGPSTTRLRLMLLLPLLMLLAQQGAWLHQLRHAAYCAPSLQAQVLAQQDDDADNGNPCPTCQAFAQISFAAHSPVAAPAFLAPGRLAGDEPPGAFVANAQPAPRSRGPPANA